MAAVWSDRYIYFAFSGHYESLNTYEGEDVSKERWELWNRDVVEVFLNPRPERVSHYYEFEVAPNNQWIDLEIEKTKTPFNDASWNSGFEHATKIDEKNHLWLTEMRIPLSAVGVDKIQNGDLWRVNFFRAAGHGGDEHRIVPCLEFDSTRRNVSRAEPLWNSSLREVVFDRLIRLLNVSAARHEKRNRPSLLFLLDQLLPLHQNRIGSRKSLTPGITSAIAAATVKASPGAATAITFTPSFSSAKRFAILASSII